jgi:hypothetical protein
MDSKKSTGRVPVWALPSKHRKRGGVLHFGVVGAILGLLLIGLFRTNWFLRVGNALVLFDYWYIPDYMPSLVIVAVIAALMIWRVPIRQVRKSGLSSDRSAFELENEARKTLAQIVGGAFPAFLSRC